MMNKKGSSTIIIWGIVVFVVIIGFFTLLVIFVINFSEEEQIIKETPLKLYLESQDSENQNNINSDFNVVDLQGVVLSKGKLSSSLTEIENIPNEKLNVYCSHKDYYTSTNEKKFSQVEINNNASKLTCIQEPFGGLSISHSGNLNGIQNTITINVTSEKSFNHLSAVLTWTPGIIDVEFRDNKIDCNGGDWVNYTYINESIEVYNWLPNNHYSCKNKIALCEKIEGIKCELKDEVPQRFNNKYDGSFYTGKSVKDNVYTFFIYVKTEEVKNNKDFVELTFYDRDLEIISGKPTLLDKESTSDFTYKIKYEV